jgi:hypothetical protein
LQALCNSKTFISVAGALQQQDIRISCMRSATARHSY